MASVFGKTEAFIGPWTVGVGKIALLGHGLMALVAGFALLGMMTSCVTAHCSGIKPFI